MGEYGIGIILLEQIRLLVNKVKNMKRKYDGAIKEVREEINDIQSGLSEEAKRAKEVVKKIKRGNKERKNVKKELSDLKKTVRHYKDRIASLEKKNRQKDKLIGIMNKDILYLKTTVKELKRKSLETDNKFAEINNALYGGQLAYDFEKALATYIYPSGTKEEQKLTPMLDWLENNRKTARGKAANRKWDKLVNEFGWEKGHERVFHKLRKHRVKFAHPKQYPAFVEIKKFTKKENERIAVIQKMNRRLKDLRRKRSR